MPPPMILSHMVIISTVTFDSPLNKIRELSCPCIPCEEVVLATLTCVRVMT